MSQRPGAIPSRQDRQAARLRGAGTAKIQNVGFKIQGGPAIRQRTPARTPQNRRPQSEDLPQGSIKRRTSGRISMPPPGPFPPAPPPRSSAKKSVAKGGPASLRKGTVSGRDTLNPSSDSVVTPAPKKASARPRKSTAAPRALALPVREPSPVEEEEEEPTPEPPRLATKRKSLAKDTRPAPAKKPRKSAAPLPPRSPTPIEHSGSEISSPSSSPASSRSASPPPRSRAKHTDTPGTVELRVHKLPPTAGGTRHLNEIDGFLQVATEVLDRTTSQMASRDATQAKILDAFTEEVTIRLIEMTDAWDSHAVLLAATKRAQRRKGLLRQELLAIRRERGDVQREMEGVRQGHEKGELEMKDLRLQHDFIGEMEEFKERIGSNGEEDNVKNGVEAALLEIRPLVAGKSGIAERLASFNRLLERFDNALTNATT